MKLTIGFILSILLLTTLPLYPQSVDTNVYKQLEKFADPGQLWGSGVETVIEEAYRECFRTYIINGVIMNLRIPFAENHEREELSLASWEVVGKGKEKPAFLWDTIDKALSSDDFAKYTEIFNDKKDKVIIFDIAAQTWTTSTDIFDIARMKAGSYHGLPHKPYVLFSERSILESDVYNWLYCTVRAGMDCSSFVWHVLTRIADTHGVNLNERMRRALGAPTVRDTSYYISTWFYNSRSTQLSSVDDKIKNLRPADILLFRTKDGTMAHSAIIQSIDLKKGIIRYVQNTDEAPLAQRGAHDSYIYFDSKNTDISIKDKSVRWQQKRFSPFEGEHISIFSDDGERYRAYGGGRVVRMNLITQLIGK